MKGLFIAMAALVAFVVSVPAQAVVQEDVNTFVQLDKNQDGYVSTEEATGQAAIEEKLAEFDRDANEKLDLEEFAALRKGQEKEGNAKDTSKN